MSGASRGMFDTIWSLYRPRPLSPRDRLRQRKPVRAERLRYRIGYQIALRRFQERDAA